MVVDFSLDFDVENSTEDDYRDLIRRIIRRLGVGFSHNRPTLVLQSNQPHFFDLVLRTRTRNHSVRFRFRTDNLYLIGYEMENGQWLELDNEQNQHLITEPGTQFLKFKGNYDTLASVGKRRVANTGVSFLNLITAIDELATETDMEKRARNLIVVIMMISESTRFIPILNHMAASFRPENLGGGEVTVPGWIETLVKSWKRLSSAVLRLDAFPEERFTLIPRRQVIVQPGSRRIATIADILTILGIMLRLRCSDDDKLKGRTTSDNDEQHCWIGVPLVQVFSVQINNIDDEFLPGGELYGTIVIDDGLNTEYIYNRTRSDYESISADEYATLIGPSEAISAIGDVTIRLLLTDKDIPGPWFDDVIMNDFIFWDSSDVNAVYDRLISKQLHSGRGSVTVNYAALQSAAVARVILSLQDGGEGTVEIYGRVIASYKNWVDYDPKTTCLLFKRSEWDFVPVNRFEDIPLLRSVVAVPLNESLKVTALLYDNDFYLTGDDLIASGTVEFPVPEKIPSTVWQPIAGERSYFVQVIIQWSYGLL